MTPPAALTLPGGAPMLVYGPRDGIQIVLLQPLFEEMNRCRALAAALCRGLAAGGIGCWLPDLPGTGEDGRDLSAVTWADWCDTALDAAALVARETGREPLSVAIRGGALIDGRFPRRWRLAPVAGTSLLRDLRRSGLTGEAMAGYALPPALADAIAAAEPASDSPARTVRLTGDERPADAHFDGPSLWRRSEPAGDDALAAALAADIATWAAA